MRVCLAKYTGVLEFEVEELPRYDNKTKIRWKLPKLTDEQEAAIRDEIDTKFGPQGSSLEKEKVVEWRINKRKSTQWDFEFDSEENEKYEFEKKNYNVYFSFHDGHCMSGRYILCERSPQIIDKRANVEFLLQIGNSDVLFNDLRQKTRAKCNYGSERFTQYAKSVPVEIWNQLKNVPRDQVSITVFGTCPEGNQGMDWTDLRSNFDWSSSPKQNWKSFDATDTDVTIWTGDEEHIYCHSNFLTRNSCVLSELLVSPTRKPFLIKLRDMKKIQLEAFLSYQYNGTTDKILEAPETSLGVLKAAERFEIWQMWTDTMEGLLDKDSEWFKEEVALKLTDSLGTCTKRKEGSTKNLIQKISQELTLQSQSFVEKSGNKESEVAGENCETGENVQVEDNREAGVNEAASACNNLGINKIRSDELAQLKLKLDPVSLLKFVQCYKNEEMWNDIILALLEKDSDWFEWNLALELKTFLDSCSKSGEESTQKLTRTLSQVLEQPRPILETTQVREKEDQNEEIAENIMNPQRGRAKRRKVTENYPNQLIGKKISRVGTLRVPVAVTRKLRRSARLQAGKRKKGGLEAEEEPLKKALRFTTKMKETTSKRVPNTTKPKPAQTRKPGLPTKDVTWTKALQVAAEKERNASKSGGAGPGPRDIWKDPVLPKISIFPDIPDPKVKVEKVELSEEESEDSPGMDGAEIQQVIQDQDCVAVTVKEESIPMDESYPNDNERAGYGVIVSSWSMRQPTDENI